MTVTDPAAVTDQGSMMLITNVFQRLTYSDPGDSEVAPGVFAFKPDLARECSFTSRLTFTCSLRDNLRFSTGETLTSSDVKFSINRAIRLDVSGSSASMFKSLRRIETPDPSTVRFQLRSYDRQFGWALASPAASIVSAKYYDPDEVQDPTSPIVGSGPFVVQSIAKDGLALTRNGNYVGATAARVDAIEILSRPSSSSVEDLISQGKTDVSWRGLSSPAVSRLENQIRASPDRVTQSGFSELTLSGARILRLQWNPTSQNRTNTALRQNIVAALQEDRTLDSVVPPQIPGHQSSFRLGGTATPQKKLGSRVVLTLGYVLQDPDAKDLASQIRDRLEQAGSISLRLVPGASDADLYLVDYKAWVPTGLSWMQSVTDFPLSASSNTYARLEADVRAAEVPANLYEALGKMQSQASRDSTVVPITQSDERLFLRPGIEMSAKSFGPGWQLGLWGLGLA